MLENSRLYQYRLKCEENTEIFFKMDSQSDIQDFEIYQGDKYIFSFDEQKYKYRVFGFDSKYNILYYRYHKTNFKQRFIYFSANSGSISLQTII